MKLILALFCLAIAVLSVSSSPIPDVVLIDGKLVSTRIDITTFLPLYGGYKLKRLVNSKSWGFIQKFIKDNKQVYEAFKSQLAPVGVTLPEFTEFNMDILTPEDYQLALTIVGEYTIEDLIKGSFPDYLINYIKTDEHTNKRLMEIIAASGITYNDNLDVDLVLNTIGDTFEPFILTFIPYALQIIIFGK